MTAYEAITKIVQAATGDDLGEAEKILEEYYQERKKVETTPRYEEMKREFYSGAHGREDLKQS